MNETSLFSEKHVITTKPELRKALCMKGKDSEMPVLKPVKGSYFLKPLGQLLYRPAAALECYSCEHFWNENDLAEMMKNPRINGWVVASAMTPVAYVVFEKIKQKPVAQILNLVVHPDHRRKGLATLFVDHVISRFAISCTSVIMSVRETNLTAQFFLQSQGFLAEKVERGYFEDHYAEEVDIEDAYLFRKTI